MSNQTTHTDPETTIKALRKKITRLEKALAQPQQEPVAWANPNDLQNFDMKVRTNAGPLHTVPLYTSPPAHEPLTDEEIRAIVRKVDEEEGHVIHFARAIEAAHGIKGEA